MEKEFVEVKTKKQAEKLCPWGAVFRKMEGGYAVYECVEEARIAKNQK